ncbi:MAG: alpha/beta fold hydrolase [Planctomycetota bacterium]
MSRLGLTMGLWAAVSGSALAQDPAEPTVELEVFEAQRGDGTAVPADRGVLRVPIKRSNPDSKEIAIEFHRFRAEEGAPEGVPPVFFLNGGPGWPGLGAQATSPEFYEESAARFVELTDVVYVGQRGIGSSTNTPCGFFEPSPVDEPVEREVMAERVREACRACREHWEGEGYDLTGLNVLEAAADVRDIAAALGYEQITLWGGSFGSHWGMAVQRKYPELVARAVLNGMEGPDHTYDMPSWVLNSLSRMAEQAEASPELEGLIPEGGLIAALDQAIKRVEEEPVLFEVKDPRSRRMREVLITADVIREAAKGVRNSVSSRRGMPTWPADMLAIHRGDYTSLAISALGDQGGRLPTASFFMLDCGSGISAERKAILDADPAAKIVGALGAFYDTACSAWDADLGADFRRNFETDVPTVIVHGTFDVNTPFENALELKPFFRESKFITVHGGSHGALWEALDESDEFSELMTEFLLSGDMVDLPDEIELAPIEWEVPSEEE